MADEAMGQVALVTGASRGIGKALAERLVAEGWLVAVLARSADALAAIADEHPGQVLPLVVDVTRADELATAGEALRERWGAPDLVVANAGVLGAVGPTWQIAPDDWWSELEVNVRGVLNTVAATVPAMVERGSGRIVLMSSGMGRLPSPWMSAYGASKAAVTHLAGSLAQELAGTGVTCFAISPGMVATEMTQWPERLMEHRPALRNLPPETFLPASVGADLVLALAGGGYDALTGRFIHARDDLDTLLAEAGASF